MCGYYPQTYRQLEAAGCLDQPTSLEVPRLMCEYVWILPTTYRQLQAAGRLDQPTSLEVQQSVDFNHTVLGKCVNTKCVGKFRYWFPEGWPDCDCPGTTQHNVWAGVDVSALCQFTADPLRALPSRITWVSDTLASHHPSHSTLLHRQPAVRGGDRGEDCAGARVHRHLSSPLQHSWCLLTKV